MSRYIPGPGAWHVDSLGDVCDQWEDHVDTSRYAHLVSSAPDLYAACRKAITCASLPDYVRDVLQEACAKADGAK